MEDGYLVATGPGGLPGYLRGRRFLPRGPKAPEPSPEPALLLRLDPLPERGTVDPRLDVAQAQRR